MVFKSWEPGLACLGISLLISYYGFALPFGLILTFGYGYGLFGLWIGLTAGLFMVSITELAYLINMDWEEQAYKAQLRVAYLPTVYEVIPGEP